VSGALRDLQSLLSDDLHRLSCEMCVIRVLDARYPHRTCEVRVQDDHHHRQSFVVHVQDDHQNLCEGRQLLRRHARHVDAANRRDPSRASVHPTLVHRHLHVACVVREVLRSRRALPDLFLVCLHR
jgi:hypothetical protein